MCSGAGSLVYSGAGNYGSETPESLAGPSARNHPSSLSVTPPGLALGVCQHWTGG